MTREEYKDEIIDKIYGRKLTVIYTICLVPIIGMFATPFIWIWDGWDFAWKFGLTSFLLFVGFAYVAVFIKNRISDAVNIIVNESGVSDETIKAKKSRFQTRMDELMAEAEKKKQQPKQ